MSPFTYLKHTALVDDNSTSTGNIKIKRPQKGQLLGLLDFLSPDKKTVALDGQTVQIYLPNMKTVQIVDLGKHKVLLEQFFLFGFGTSRRDLEAAYSVSYGGPESVNGEATTRLVLISNNPDVKKQLSKFELWMPTCRDFRPASRSGCHGWCSDAGVASPRSPRCSPISSFARSSARFVWRCSSTTHADR